MTMPEAVAAIIAIAARDGRPEAEVYAEKRAEWKLPTSAPWEMLRNYPYA